MRRAGRTRQRCSDRKRGGPSYRVRAGDQPSPPETIAGLHRLIDVENRDDERIEGLIANGATLDPNKRLIRFVLDG